MFCFKILARTFHLRRKMSSVFISHNELNVSFLPSFASLSLFHSQCSCHYSVLRSQWFLFFRQCAFCLTCDCPEVVHYFSDIGQIFEIKSLELRPELVPTRCSVFMPYTHANEEFRSFSFFFFDRKTDRGKKLVTNYLGAENMNNAVSVTQNISVLTETRTHMETRCILWGCVCNPCIRRPNFHVLFFRSAPSLLPIFLAHVCAWA